jgi:hypothetical protein
LEGWTEEGGLGHHALCHELLKSHDLSLDIGLTLASLALLALVISRHAAPILALNALIANSPELVVVKDGIFRALTDGVSGQAIDVDEVRHEVGRDVHGDVGCTIEAHHDDKIILPGAVGDEGVVVEEGLDILEGHLSLVADKDLDLCEGLTVLREIVALQESGAAEGGQKVVEVLAIDPLGIEGTEGEGDDLGDAVEVGPLVGLAHLADKRRGGKIHAWQIASICF